MRSFLLVLPVVAFSTGAFAQAPAPKSPRADMQFPRELTDPAIVARLGNTMQALSDALLDLRVGEMKAAMEGRPASATEKRLTVRDLGRRKDPNFDRNFQQQIAEAGPRIEQSMRALNSALPAMTKALQQASDAVERAAANMPDPTYPRR